MSLYPQIELEPAGMFEVPSGSLGLVALDVPADGAVDVTVRHIGLTQDHSLRCWLSYRKGGEAIPLLENRTAVWHPNRTPDEKVTVAGTDWGGSSQTFSAKVTGRVWLNLLNLVNQVNAFAITTDARPD